MAATVSTRQRRRPGFQLESELYLPVKQFLEAEGYQVKGEVRGCDVVAVRGEAEPMVVVELKLAFTLSFVMQGLDRLAVTDLVYLAVPAGAAAARAFSPEHSGVRRLCRRLGLGLLAVHPAPVPAMRANGNGRSAAAASAGRVEVVLDPVPCRVPRRNKARAARLLGEHARRHGDPNHGGSAGRPLVTAYRQEALRCADLLRRRGGGDRPLPVAVIRKDAAAPNAARILYRNVYGWFEPNGRGLYRLTEAGAAGLDAFAGSYAPASEEAERKA